MIRRLLCTLVGGGVLAAAIGAETLDPQTEERLRLLSEELRCLVCQNESLASSRAELAVDLRREIVAQMRAGKTDHEISDYLVARYGEFILYRPRWSAKTAVLWLGPALLLAGGAFWLWRQLRQGARLTPATELTPDERARAEQLFDPERRRP
jgi:cytochrome c-type biogenesis protein CcmH